MNGTPRPRALVSGARFVDGIKVEDAAGVRMLQQTAETLEGRRSGLPAGYDGRTGTGPPEGANAWATTHAGSAAPKPT